MTRCYDVITSWPVTLVLCPYSFCLMLGAHGKTFAEQSASRATLLSKVLTVCGDFFVRFLPREPKNQKSNWFDNFCLARHFAHRVRSYEHFAQHFDLYIGGQACAVG